MLLQNTVSEEILLSLNEGFLIKDQRGSNKLTSSEKDMNTKKISRRARGRNIVQMVHSDCDEELKSVASDNPHLYTSSVRYFKF